MTGQRQHIRYSVSLCPHPEEARSAVSKEDSVCSGPSFETQTASAPQDEVSGKWNCKEEES